MITKTQGTTHGSHWDCAIANAEEALADVVMQAAGQPPETASPDDDLQVMRSTISPGLEVVALTRGGEVITAFPTLPEADPLAAGVPQAYEWNNGVEAWARGHVGPATFYWFASDYATRRQDYETGFTGTVRLSGFLYSLYDAVDLSVRDQDGTMHRGRDICLIQQAEKDRGFGVDDYQFQGRILEMTPSGLGQILRLLIVEHPQFNLHLNAYCLTKNMTITPEVGGTVSGMLWLQAALA